MFILTWEPVCEKTDGEREREGLRVFRCGEREREREMSLTVFFES